MKAMILAAGYGKRMLPLTDTTPKPLLRVAGKPLIVYHIEKLRALGVLELVINIAHLGEQIEAFLGDGSAFGVTIQYSKEAEPLETGGAVLQALPLLGQEPFLLINGDVWSDYPLQQLLRKPLPEQCLGRLVLIANPDHNLSGDFTLDGELLTPHQPGGEGFTFSGISLLRPQLIAACRCRRKIFPLREAFAEAIATAQLMGEVYSGQWWDVGTPERLRALDHHLQTSISDQQ